MNGRSRTPKLMFKCCVCGKVRPQTELVMSTEGAPPFCKTHNHNYLRHCDERWTPQALLNMFGYQYEGRKIVSRLGRPPKEKEGRDALQGNNEA